MKYRPLGNTGLQVSEISFGTGDNAGLMVSGTEQQQTDAVTKALELGVNYFDTSPDYGKGKAEINLGRILKKLGAKPIVTTKVEVMPPDLGDIESKVDRSIDESLARLGMTSVDIVMIHNAPRLTRNPDAAYWTPLVPDDYLGPSLRALERARKAGKVKFFGFSTEHAQPAATVPLLESGKFHVVNMWFNLVNPTAGMDVPDGPQYGDDYEDYGGILNAAGKAGVGTAIIRPLDGGALAPAVVSGGVHNRHPLSGGVYTRRPEVFAPEVARGRAFGFLHLPERSLPKAAFAFILANPNVSTVIGGFSDQAQFEELVACSGAPPLAASELERVRDVYRNNFYLTA